MGSFYAKEFGEWVAHGTKGLYRKESGQWVSCESASLDTRERIYEWLPQTVGVMGYVSLGDSIAAGHMITDTWVADYGGTGAQYGNGGNQETFRIPGCYTDLIGKELEAVYGDKAYVKSFAQSGDTVADLMEKLTQEPVRNAIREAKLVTICIGANDVLQPAMSRLDEYINTGSLANAEATIEANMARLASDTAANSYKALFDRLNDINPDAKYVFTTVYNPYKYLYLDEGHSGFFGPLLATIPQMNIDVDKIIEDTFLGGTDLSYYDITKLQWVSIELELDLDGLIKDGLLATPAIQQLFNRVNNLGAWAEKYVEGTDSFDGMNRVLRRKIAQYQAVNPNFSVVDTKAAFDLFPDRTDSNADVDYSDLVNVEFTRTFDTMEMDWGALWRPGYGDNVAQYWGDLAWKYLSFSNALPSLNVWDYVSFNLDGFAAELAGQIVDKVIVPDVDPHPEHHGHEVMKRVFTNALGLVKYERNGGSGVPGEVLYDGEAMKAADPRWLHHTFEGWHTDAGLTQEVDLENATFTDTVETFTLEDLVDGSTVISVTPKTTALYAEWSSNIGAGEGYTE